MTEPGALKHMTFGVHPAALLFPEPTPEEYASLKADIEAHGQRDPISVAPDGRIVDGRSRHRACLELGIEPRLDRVAGSDAELAELSVSRNLHRRHLSQAQRRELIAKLLKATPEKSDRQIADMAKVKHDTVGAVRQQLESGGQIGHLTKRAGKDGKLQAAKKNTISASSGDDPEPYSRLTAKLGHKVWSQDRSGEWIEGKVTKIGHQLCSVELTNGKSVQRPFREIKRHPPKVDPAAPPALPNDSGNTVMRKAEIRSYELMEELAGRKLNKSEREKYFWELEQAFHLYLTGDLDPYRESPSRKMISWYLRIP